MEHSAERQSLSEADSLTHAVVTAVAEEKSVPPEEIAGRIYDVVDPDGLDRLFSAGGSDTPRNNARLSFEIAGCEVVIEGGELLMVTRARTPAERFEREH